MILEAFAKYLQTADPQIPASTMLSRWLWERLSSPPETLTDRVLRSEVELKPKRKGERFDEHPSQTMSAGPGSDWTFCATSASGKRLLRSLYEYASSYEQQKWSRWVHKVKATDFNRLHNED